MRLRGVRKNASRLGTLLITVSLVGCASAPQRSEVRVEKVEKLFSNQIVVPHGQMVWQQIKVDTSAMRDVRVVGRFHAAGGSGNDVQAILADSDDFENWKNGHPAQALYSTEKTTVSCVNVPIPKSGTYFFGFSNAFSAFTDKTVSADIELRYTVRNQ